MTGARTLDLLVATASHLPRVDEDQAPLCAALAAAGVIAEVRAWDDPDVDWAAARACVIRSTWNYVRHHDAFLAWTERCAAATALWNPPPVVRWNSHKRYLVELGQAGLPVVPTRLAPRGQPADLAALVGDWTGDDAIVIKPAVSAGSYRTLRARRAGDEAETARAQAHLDVVLADQDALIQPFQASVADYGERALVWIDGAFTHAVRKTARFAGDPQRVSDAVPIAPDEARVGDEILAYVREQLGMGPLLYARVDLARDADGRPRLMELELIEPSLFLARSADAMERFVGGVKRALGSR